MVWWHHLVHTPCEIQNLSVVSHSQDFPEAPPLPAARHWPWHFQPKPQPILPYPSVRHSLKVLPKSSSQLQLRKSENLLNLGNDAVLLTTFDSFNFCLKIQTPSFQDQSRRWLSSSGQSKPPPESAERTRPRKAAAGGQLRPRLLGSKNVKGKFSVLEMYARAQITSI